MRQFWIAPFLGLCFAAAAPLAQAERAGRVPLLADSASCPAAPDHQGAVDLLIGRVQAAPDEASAQQISNQFWQYWADAPNAQAQALLDRGMTRRSAFDFLGALEAFDRLVAYCPDYAEGYNQRAFVHYLRRDFGAALTDLDRAIALSPRHVAALSGRALSLYGLSRLTEARQALEQALALNPWLPERHLVAPGGPLAPEGAGPTTPEVDL
ncbi:tetratricopeptide repeat protein [Phaeobacter sp. A36a-5a]|uniref:tetratricopeptide repeat protein n=1 Tax=Phaeobacter bryozoorum TaxID=1086632 RepID=UPI0030C96045